MSGPEAETIAVIFPPDCNCYEAGFGGVSTHEAG